MRPPTSGGGAVGAGRTTPGRAKSKEGNRYEDWDWWWDLNEERFLLLKNKVRSKASASTNVDIFLGADASGGDKARVSLRTIRNEIVPTLILALKDPFYDARSGAVIALGKVADSSEPDKLDAIKGLMGDDVRQVRESAWRALGILGAKEAVPFLFSIVKNDPAARRTLGRGTSDILNRTRAFAAVAIGLIGSREGFDDEDEVIDELLRLARSTDNASRDLAVGPSLALQLIKSQRSIPGMIEIFKDETVDDYVRAHVGVGLGKLGAKSAVKDLVRGLTDKNTYVAQSSAIALGLLVSPEDRDTVKALRNHAKSASNRSVRNFAMIALGEIGAPEGIAMLVDRLKKGQPQDKAFGALGLGVYGFKNPEARIEFGADVLREYQETKAADLRGAIAISLGLLDFEPAKEVLLGDLKRVSDQNLQGHLCTALGLMGYRDAIPEIQKMVVQRGDTDLRKRAAIALGLLQDPEAVGLLEKVIQDSGASKGVLGAATVALGYVGDRSAVPILVKMLENKSGEYQDMSRAFATVALGFLGDKDDIPMLSKVQENSNYMAQTEAVAELLSIL